MKLNPHYHSNDHPSLLLLSLAERSHKHQWKRAIRLHENKWGSSVSTYYTWYLSLMYTAIWSKCVCSVKFTWCWCIFGRSCQHEQDVVDRFKIDLDTVSTVDVAKTCILISFSWIFPAEPNVGNNVKWVLFNSFLLGGLSVHVIWSVVYESWHLSQWQVTICHPWYLTHCYALCTRSFSTCKLICHSQIQVT